MSRSSPAVDTLPIVATHALLTLGEHLRIARERRGESLRKMAIRMNVSVPTLRRMEAGDPSVSIGIYATALWIFDSVTDLEGLARPEDDSYAMRLDIDRASRKRRKAL